MTTPPMGNPSRSMSSRGIALIAIVALGGCGPRIEMATVRGRVLVDGKPLGSGSVMVQPKIGPAARGQIGADGSFELSTYRPGDGVRLGPAAVRVTSVARGVVAANQEQTTGESLIPMRYADFTTSGISIDVKSGMEPVEIKLTGK